MWSLFMNLQEKPLESNSECRFAVCNPLYGHMYLDEHHVNNYVNYQFGPGQNPAVNALLTAV